MPTSKHILFSKSYLFVYLVGVLAIVPSGKSLVLDPIVETLRKDTNECVLLPEGQYAFVPFGAGAGKTFFLGASSTAVGAPIVAVPENANAPENVPQEFARIPGPQRGFVSTLATWDVKLSTTRNTRNTHPDGNELFLYTVINRATGLVLSTSGGERSLTQERPDSSGLERNDDWCFRLREGQPGKDRRLSYKVKGPFSVSIENFPAGRAIRYLRDTNRRSGDDMIITAFGTGRNALFLPRLIGGVGGTLPFPRLTPAPTPAPTTCNAEGATCGVDNVCCRGFICQTSADGSGECIENRAPAPRGPGASCQAEGVSCAGGKSCCNPLACQNIGNSNLVCRFLPTVPSPPTSPTPPTPTPPTPTPPTAPTPPTTGGVCQGRGRTCGNGVLCCGGLTCQGTNFGNLCRPAPFCQTRGRPCGNGVSCCNGLSCQGTNFGNLCRPNDNFLSPTFPPPNFPTPPVPAPSPSTFNTLLFLVGPSCTSVASELAGSTIFGPTDAAFAAFFSSTGLTVNALCGGSAGGIDTISSILTYHVIPGFVTGADIRELIPNIVEFQSLFGEIVSVDTVNLKVNGVKISIPDARSTPFVLHGIDGVLLPPNTPGIPTLPPSSCVTRGRKCETGACCDGLKCQRTNFGRLCRPNKY